MRRLLPALLLLAVAFGVLAWRIGAELQRTRRNEALLAAVGRGDAAAVGVLLDRGADPNVRAHSSRTFRDNLLSKVGLGPGTYQEPPVLWMAAQQGNVEAVRALLERGANPNATAFYGKTVLMAAVDGYGVSSLSVVERLLEAGANPNGRATNGQTALMLASQRSAPETVRRLLEAGADVNAQDIYGMTPLMYVAQVGDAATMTLLLGAGADPNAADRDGKTARMRVSGIGHANLVRLLRQAGARK